MNDKRSYTEYTVTTATTDFVIGFDDYDDGTKDTIVVTVNGVLAESQGYAVMRKNAQVVTITPAVQSGTVRLERVTGIDESFHQFTAGALFSAKSMDENFQQVRHSQQEVRDGFTFLQFNTLGIVAAAKAATQAALDAAQVVADLVLGIVRAQDVSTVSGKTQEEKNTEFDTYGYDTGITVTAKFGGVERSQAAVNSDTINAAQFGLLTNSTADQTLALQQFINYLALNGGYGEVTQSTYNFSDTLSLPESYTGKGFTVDFKDSTLVLTSTANKAPISFITPKDVLLKNCTIDAGYSRTGNENHGVSFSNPKNSVCENITVTDYRMSGILFFINSAGMIASSKNADGTYRDCHIRNCTANGNGLARNGFLLVDLYASTIDGCTARGLDRTSSPCVGLQLKNLCRQSMILNSTAEDCLAGVAIGGDGANLGDAGESCLVSNITVVNCLDGMIVSKAVNCDFKNIVIDMVGKPNNLVGVNIAGKNTGITVDAVVKNIPSTSKALLMRSSFSYADIKLPTGLHSDTVHFATIGAGVQHSNIIVSQMRRGEPSTNLLPLIENLSAFTSNTFKFALSQDSSGITGDSYHYFSTPQPEQSYLAYGGSSKTYTFKAGGDNLLFIRNNGLAPFNDGIMALGGSGRRFSALYAASGTIVVSDERLKTEILPSNEAEKRAALRIKNIIGKYKFKDSVTKKGDKARYHYGVGAQTVEQIMRDEGLEPFEYGFLCYNTWEADGDVPAGEGYSIRYEELAMFILAAI